MFFTFWKAVLRQAVSRADQHETNAHWCVRLAIVFVAIMSPTLAEWVTTVSLPWWFKAAPFFVHVFIWSPYVVWKREHVEAEKLRERLITRLSVYADVQIGHKARVKTATLRVVREGFGQVKNCTGQVLRVERQRDAKRVLESIYTYLRWSAGDGGDRTHTFQSIGHLDVVQIAQPYRGNLRVMGVKTVSGQVFPNLLSEHSRYVLTIEVAAENTEPVTHDYFCYVEPLGQHAPTDGYGDNGDAPLPELISRKL
jgi:hypothetical protein